MVKRQASGQRWVIKANASIVDSLVEVEEHRLALSNELEENSEYKVTTTRKKLR